MNRVVRAGCSLSCTSLTGRIGSRGASASASFTVGLEYYVDKGAGVKKGGVIVGMC